MLLPQRTCCRFNRKKRETFERFEMELAQLKNPPPQTTTDNRPTVTHNSKLFLYTIGVVWPLHNLPPNLKFETGPFCKARERGSAKLVIILQSDS